MMAALDDATPAASTFKVEKTVQCQSLSLFAGSPGPVRFLFATCVGSRTLREGDLKSGERFLFSERR